MEKKKIILIIILASVLVSFIPFLIVVAIYFINGPRVDVPQAGMFVFGDSTVDNGGSNVYNTTYKSDYYPYAVDSSEKNYSHTSISFSDQDALANRIASRLKMQAPIPIANIKDFSMDIKAGLNFAFGASGVLSNTGKKFGETIPLQEQIKRFAETLRSNNMSTVFKSKSDLQNYISNSVYLISAGQNDVFEYFEQGSKQAFPTDMVVDTIMKRIKVLYELGARKIVVFELLPIGCSPLILNISNINKRLESAIDEFKKTSSAAKEITLGKTFELINSTILTHPSVFGFKESKFPCCAIDKEGLCIRTGGKVCGDRAKFLYFDGRHFTYAAYSIVADACVTSLLAKWKV